MDYKVVDLRQRHLVAWNKEIKRLQPEEWDERSDLPLAVYYDIFIKACLRAGWMTDLNEDDVDDMTWQEINDLYDLLAAEMTERTALEKN